VSGASPTSERSEPEGERSEALAEGGAPRREVAGRSSRLGWSMMR
jgi:hypothetical protein